MFHRYAVFFVPPPGDLARLGAAWLGWDLRAGKPVAHPELPGIDVAATTKRPRKYGLHGTIKAPFHLGQGISEADLADALASFCETQAPVLLDGLALSQIGRFLALTPLGDGTLLTDLAARAIRTLDPLRAPLTQAEFARKNRPHLSAAERSNLENWGYPYVMEAFRFHITLTGPLRPEDAGAVKNALAAHLQPAPLVPFAIDSLSLCGEAEDARFREIVRYPLKGVANNGL